MNDHNNKIKVGDVVFFGYKSNESFYDRFPLVLILSIKRGHGVNFLGFNLHYMPPDIRTLLLQELRDSGYNGAKQMSREEIPRRYFTSAIKTYTVENIITKVKVFSETELTDVINTIVPVYDAKTEVNIIKHLDKVFVNERRE